MFCLRPSALEILPPELTHPCEQRPPPLPSTHRCTVDVGAVGMWRCDSKVTVVRHHSSQHMVSFRYHVVANGSENDGQKSKVPGKLNRPPRQLRTLPIYKHFTYLLLGYE